MTASPPPLEALLGDLGPALMTVPGARSVMVAGSAGRGEAGLLPQDGGAMLLGDVELLLVVTRRRPHTEVDSMVARAVAGAEGFAAPPRIEVAQIPTRRLRGLQRKLFVHEAREAGRCIGGEDLRGAMPAVHLDNLDRDDLDEVYLHRLEALLSAFEDDQPEVGQTYALARNTLDLVTMMLPEVGVLLPTYRARAEHVREHPDLAFLAAMPPGFAERVQRYTCWKLDPAAIPSESTPTLADCLHDFDAAAAWLRARGRLRLHRYARRRRGARAALVVGRAIARREAPPMRALRWLPRQTLRDRAQLARMLLGWRATGAPDAGPPEGNEAYRLLDRVSLAPVAHPSGWASWRRAYLDTRDVHQGAG